MYIQSNMGNLKFFFFLSFITGLLPMIYGQEYVQIEIKNDPETIKYPIGDVIKIKTKYEPEVFKNIQILGFDYTNNSLIYEDGRIALDEITVVQQTRPAVGFFSKMFMTFGGAWLGFGLLGGELGKNEISGYADLAIGLSSVGLGYGMHKAFHKRNFKMGERYRLRLIDLRMR
jgi:hypothetical protein